MGEVIFILAPATNFLTLWQIQIIAVHLLGIACFSYIIAKRIAPLTHGESDPRFDRPLLRLGRVLQFWLGQWKHPRYRGAGTIHILIFAGFMVLAIHTFAVLIFGASGNVIPGLSGAIGRTYGVAKDYAETVVFLAIVVAALRRLIVRPERYAVPTRYGKAHTADAIFLLALIAILMLAESLFEASSGGARLYQGDGVELGAELSLPWILGHMLAGISLPRLSQLHNGAYLLNALVFWFLLCYRPFGIQFHVITSLFNVYFAKLDKGTIKPVRWGVTDERLDKVKSFGVKKFEDFTWKHMLDCYSCADCGRCSDQCPSKSVGRPLSPRFLTIKARDYSFEHYPIFGGKRKSVELVGSIFSEDEIWSCTTCGACEEECPLLIEYIDKIVDLRRGLVEDGNVPQSIQKALKALESRGNPYGKVAKKRADWTRTAEFQEASSVEVLEGGGVADTLYFVDSITSYDDRIQLIARATAKILDRAGESFAILGPAEQDSGHDVRRFGEEMLYIALRDHNVEAIKASGVRRIVTSDPHAYNALKHDYKDVPPVEHISELIARAVKSGKIRLSPLEDTSDVYVYHDPCYLGRHNQIYEAPRDVLDAIPGMRRVEMSRCRDRSFCCGGGGLMQFYEPKEDQRMGVKRVKMAAEVGANVIITACPFCMVNMEDAIKVAGMESKMTAIDLTELVERQTFRHIQSEAECVRG
jgi:Fe-S oxidoreductase